MKLKQWKEQNAKKKAIVVGSVFVVLLISVVVLLRSFALFETKQEYNVISGVVPKSSDITLSFLLEENGSKKVLQTMPEGKEYQVTVSCNKNATGSWDYESWGPVIGNLSESLTRCQIIFSPAKLLENIIKENIVTTGSGVYEVTHEDAVIGTHMNATQTNNLKQTEYRYAGQNPNNYIKFNNELWRIIGFVNTPEGSRVKLIRNDGIGDFSWNISESSINSGAGINEWSQANIMKLLNPGYESESVGGSLYWNQQKGNCYKVAETMFVSCDFTNNGLKEESKSKIDSITWNVGTNGSNSFVNSSNGTPNHFYNYERSNSTGKICTSGVTCNDTISRTTTWNGKVGLMNPTDYGYATTGGTTTSRSQCINTSPYAWRDFGSECYGNDWLHDTTSYQWTMTPRAYYADAFLVFYIHHSGYLNSNNSSVVGIIRPSLYLTSNQKVIQGNGTQDNPFVIL